MHGIDQEIQDGEFVVFVGPSDCGKSTVQRMLAGLEEITQGTVAIGDTVVNDVALSKRGVAMVFQTYALYPHMKLYKSMSFGLNYLFSSGIWWIGFKMNRSGSDVQVLQMYS